MEKPGYVLEFDEDFDAPVLDRRRWLPHYLPQWSSRDASAARYAIGDGALTLRIDRDQQPWCPEFDGGVKVSSFQTGVFAGPVGSAIGQHRFNERVRVREEQRTERLYVPRHGLFEMRARADIGVANLVALWMIGFEEQPEDSGEITIMEIFGKNITPKGTRLGHGIKRVNDARLTQDFHEDLMAFDPADWHDYAVEWTAKATTFFLDGAPLRSIAQSPAYPMQFMLNIYELPGAAPPRDRPATFTIDYLRGWRRAGAQPSARLSR